MKQSEIFDLAMSGIIELMNQEQDEERKEKLNQALKELAMMFVLAEREERREQFYTCGRQKPLKWTLGALKRVRPSPTGCHWLIFPIFFGIINT